jgi:hypothetical protein
MMRSRRIAVFAFEREAHIEHPGVGMLPQESFQALGRQMHHGALPYPFATPVRFMWARLRSGLTIARLA